jgi:sirohydrochlorin cobaltochelatase
LEGLILFSHGSLLCGAGEALEVHAARLRESGRWAAVEIGYMNYSRPSFTESVSRMAQSGIRRITVQPYFLVPGKFITSDLPRHAALARAAHSDLEFRIGDPIGYDETIAEALLELAAAADEPAGWREDLRRAAAACEDDSRCPLFGTAQCPKTHAQETAI